MRLLAAVAACLLACGVPAPCQEEIAVSVDVEPSGQLVVTAGLSGVDLARLESSLSRGLEAAVTFELRLYRRTTGLRSLLGDRLLGQVEVARRASMDVVDGSYILFDGTRETRLSGGGDQAVSDLLALSGFRLPWQAEAGTYLLARARLEYVRLDPPLHIVRLFRPTAATTEWKRVELVRAEGKLQ